MSGARRHCVHVVLAGMMLAAWECAADDQPLPLKLTKSLKELDKPAEFVYTRPSGKDASQIWNVAATVDMAISQLSREGLTTSATMTASIAKDTLASKKSDTRALTAGLRSLIQAAEHTTVPVGIFASAEDDRVKRARGGLYRVQADLVTNHLKWFGSDSDSSKRSFVKVFPRVGYYLRDVRHAAEGNPVGRYGGPYAYAYAIASVGAVTPKFDWLRKAQLELTAQVAKDTTATGGFTKLTNRFYEGTLSYALYDSPDNPWKPSLGITRTVGADPITNQPYKVQTAVSFRVGYGL